MDQDLSRTLSSIIFITIFGGLAFLGINFILQDNNKTTQETQHFLSQLAHKDFIQANDNTIITVERNYTFHDTPSSVSIETDNQKYKIESNIIEVDSNKGQGVRIVKSNDKYILELHNF